MITVDADDVWEKYVQTDANACTMRFKNFPFYSAWCEIFGKDGATGEHVEDLNGACNDYLSVFEDDMNGNGSDNEFMSVCQEQASASGKQAHQKKRKVQESDHMKFGEAVQMLCSQTDSRLGESAKWIGFEFDAFEKRTKVYEALCKISGLGLTEMTFVSMQLAKDKKILDLFFSILDDAREEIIRLMITRQAP